MATLLISAHDPQIGCVACGARQKFCAKVGTIYTLVATSHVVATYRSDSKSGAKYHFRIYVSTLSSSAAMFSTSRHTRFKPPRISSEASISLAWLGCFHQERENGFTGYVRQPYSEETVLQLEHSRGQSSEWVRMLCGRFCEQSWNSVLANCGFWRKNKNK